MNCRHGWLLLHRCHHKCAAAAGQFARTSGASKMRQVCQLHERGCRAVVLLR